MIAAGVILLILGILAKNGIAWTVGIVAMLLGLIALLLGVTGHGVAGRRHYW